MENKVSVYKLNRADKSLIFLKDLEVGGHADNINFDSDKNKFFVGYG